MQTAQPDLDQQTIDALSRRHGFTDRTARAVFRAREYLLLAIASALVKLREGDDPLALLLSQLKEKDLRICQLEQSVELLQARMNRIDSRHRKHYSPQERFKIILYKETYSLTVEDTTKLFLISVQTVGRWIDQAVKEPGKATIGSLLKAVPPLMSYSAVVRDLALTMNQLGFGGNLRIAQTLAREGIKVSKDTVRRWRKCHHKPKPASTKPGPGIVAKHPNHVWMIDITEIPGLFNLFKFKLAVVLDVFSRMPLAAQFFTKEPTADQMAGLVRHAAAKHGSPKHFISDQGSQFTAAIFRTALAALGVKQRFGAIGQTGSIAIIERFWRTLKEMLLLNVRPPLHPDDLHARLLAGLYYYAHHKPHQGINGATPAELYYGKTPACLNAARPHRAYEDKSDDKLFEISCLDPERLLPVLIPKAA
ncbi:MAG TPA: DDE-type integrase/transposase/recombinase [Blastocatellia bacterium]